MPDAANTKDTTVPNKKYVDNNFEPKRLPVGQISNQGFLYGANYDGKIFQWRPVNVDASNGSIPIRMDGLNFSVGDLTADSPSSFCANKKYVDDAISSISSTTQTKYQHNLVLEGMKDGFTFKTFLSVSRSDNTVFSTFDEVVQAIGSSSIPCTGYVYDGTKYYSIYVLDGSVTTLNYLNPDSGEQMLAITDVDVVNITDDTIEF